MNKYKLNFLVFIIYSSCVLQKAFAYLVYCCKVAKIKSYFFSFLSSRNKEVTKRARRHGHKYKKTEIPRKNMKIYRKLRGSIIRS